MQLDNHKLPRMAAKLILPMAYNVKREKAVLMERQRLSFACYLMFAPIKRTCLSGLLTFRGSAPKMKEIRHSCFGYLEHVCHDWGIAVMVSFCTWMFQPSGFNHPLKNRVIEGVAFISQCSVVYRFQDGLEFCRNVLYGIPDYGACSENRPC